jgi:hypothetical protein
MRVITGFFKLFLVFHCVPCNTMCTLQSNIFCCLVTQFVLQCTLMKECTKTFRLTHDLNMRLQKCADYFERTPSDIIYRCLSEYLPILEASIAEEKKSASPFSSLANNKPRKP